MSASSQLHQVRSRQHRDIVARWPSGSGHFDPSTSPHNGKGSVTAMVDAALRRAGMDCALHLTPSCEHHRAVRHRRRPVTEDALAPPFRRARRDRGASRGGALTAQPTSSEVTTAAAFELFRRAASRCRARSGGAAGSTDNVVVARRVVATAITRSPSSSALLDRRARDGSKSRHRSSAACPSSSARRAEAKAAIEQVARERGAEIVEARRRL